MEGNVRYSPQVSSCSIKVRLVLSSIGVAVGLIVFFFFSFHYRNYNAGLWGLVSGLAAGLALGVTIAYSKHVWDGNPRQLKNFMLTGCFIQLAGICGFVAYLVLAISKNQDLIEYEDGYYLTTVWCFMTWKWGFALLMYSRTFLRSYQEKESLIQGEEAFGNKSAYDSVGEKQ
ncbi:unnamed protein product [Candidula unifasciata]|uniref:Uncharacterized protein n=1 Tax=Candidula unifasciata TaxID=100452 RepID=A0A8S4ACF5_9EUPU|nr:unnamed protein product [Candidula unifasciata]